MTPPPLRDLGRLWRTVRHLRPEQLVGQLWYRVYTPRPDLRPAPPRRRAVAPLVAPALREAVLVGPRALRVLGQDLQADRWHDGAELLALYNIHYFDDLVARGAADRRAWHRDLLEAWLRDNPPGSQPGWAPYPTSLRLVNVIRWIVLGADPWPELLDSLAVQVRQLERQVEWHIGANHVLANAKAIAFAGAFFAGGARRWQRGVERFDGELDEQILADGAHYELSPMYHATVLADLLDLIAIGRCFGCPVPDRWPSLAGRMLGWLRQLTHPDGQIALFNDAALDIAPVPADLEAYAAQLGIAPAPVTLGPSGYVRLEQPRAVLLADFGAVGPGHQPGHAHADTLGFELSVDGQRLLVDSGTGRYGVGAERLRQRGTAAHNTVTVDGQDSSEVWSGFRVGRRAAVHDVLHGHHGVSGWHDGYTHLAGSPRHHRRLRLEPGRLEVVDTVSGRGRHTVVARFHAHPSVGVRPDGDGIQVGAARLRVRGGRARVEATTYHPRFGASDPSQVVVVAQRGRLPIELVTTVEW